MIRPLHSIYIVGLIMAAFLFGNAYAADSVHVIDTCNNSYHKGDYEEAVSCYRQLADDHLSSEVLYNLGNSYAQMGKTGYAILYYVRALCLSPGDPDIAGNLSHVREEAGIFPPEQTPVAQFFSFMTVSQWSWLALAGLLCYLLLAVFQLKNWLSPPKELLLTLLCATILVLGVTGALTRYREWQQSVIVTDSRLIVSPFEGAETVGSIQQGRLVTIDNSYKDYFYVVDRTGRKGWIPSSSLQPILPD